MLGDFFSTIGDGDLEDGTDSHSLIGVTAEGRCRELLSASPLRVGSGLRNRSFLGVERTRKLSVWNSNSGGTLLSAGGNVSCGLCSVPPEFSALAVLTTLVNGRGLRNRATHLAVQIQVLAPVPVP